jgi:hypothetical protein
LALKSGQPLEKPAKRRQPKAASLIVEGFGSLNEALIKKP